MGNSFRVLDLVRPFLRFLPIVDEPRRRIPLTQKVVYTGTALFVFLLFSHFPLYGIHAATGADPFYWMRAILASNRGTLMELGISPIVTSGMVMQLLTGTKIIKFDNSNHEDRKLLKGAQKLLALLITLGEAIAYVFCGMYGSVDQLGTGNAILIVFQLFCSGIIVLMIDELLEKGYGLGSAISLFIATNVGESVIWKAFSPVTVNVGRGVEVEGAVLALVNGLIMRTDRVRAIREAVFRQHLPNITNLLATVLVFLATVYIQGVQVEVPVKATQVMRGKKLGPPVRGQTDSYPIKLLYTSNMPVILQAALVSNIHFISQCLSQNFNGNLLVDLLGKWQVSAYSGGHFIPVSGLAYYVTAPTSLAAIAANPFHAVFYTAFMLVICGLLSKAWIEVSGSTARDVTKQLKEQHLVIPGHRESDTQKVLNRYIPTAALLGGICIGALTVLADSMGAIGSGTGILLTATTVCQLIDTVKKESSRGGIKWHRTSWGHWFFGE